MARFLLGWELGAGRGHIVRLEAIARDLLARGHQVDLALQRLDGAAALPGLGLWQAPIWPRLLVNSAPFGGPAPATMGDILVRLGLDDEDAFAGLIAGWDAILAFVRPDAAIADYAPALLCAARGRVPTVASGLWFDCVPAHLPSFPSLTGAPAVYEESPLLAGLNRALQRTGRAPLDRLPAIFAADRVLPGSFAELDFYAGDRQEELAAPSVAHPVGEAGGGQEVFVYGSEGLKDGTALWEGLARAQLPVRVHLPRASEALIARFQAFGFPVERSPLPFAQIAARSRLVMSHGGLGFVSSALAAGVPQVVVHYDLEKRLNGEAVMRMRLGGQVSATAIDPAAFAASLRALYEDEDFQRRAHEAAPSFRSRLAPRQEELTVRAVLELAGAPSG